MEGFDLVLADDSEVAAAMSEAVVAFRQFANVDWFGWAGGHLMARQVAEHKECSLREEARLRHEAAKIQAQQIESERSLVETSTDIEMSQETLRSQETLMSHESEVGVRGSELMREELEQGLVAAQEEVVRQAKVEAVRRLKEARKASQISVAEFKKSLGEVNESVRRWIDKGKEIARTLVVTPSDLSDDGGSQGDDGKRKRVASPEFEVVDGTVGEVVCDWCARFADPSLKCVVEEGSLRCTKCRKDKKGCFWSGKTRVVKNKPPLKKAKAKKTPGKWFSSAKSTL